MKIIQAGLVESAHDLSDGGLAVAIAESCFSIYRRQAVGCEVDLRGDLSQAALLFAETPSRILLSADDSKVDQILKAATEANVRAAVIGRTGGDRLRISVNGEPVIDRAVMEVEYQWRNALPAMLEVASLIAAEEK